jgi:hypothetical protein
MVPVQAGETLQIAREVGATTYAEKPYTSIDIAPDRTSFRYRSLTDVVLYNPYTGAKISLCSFLAAATRYLYIRRKLSDIIDAPGYLTTIHKVVRGRLAAAVHRWISQHFTGAQR